MFDFKYRYLLLLKYYVQVYFSFWLWISYIFKYYWIILHIHKKFDFILILLHCKHTNLTKCYTADLFPFIFFQLLYEHMVYTRGYQMAAHWWTLSHGHNNYYSLNNSFFYSEVIISFYFIFLFRLNSIWISMFIIYPPFPTKTSWILNVALQNYW